MALAEDDDDTSWTVVVSDYASEVLPYYGVPLVDL